MPAAMRFSANAGRIAARAAFASPWLYAAAIGLPIAYSWYQNSGYEVKGGVWSKKVDDGCESGCYLYSIPPASPSTSAMGAAGNYAQLNTHSSPTDSISFTPTSCNDTHCTFSVVQYIDGNFYSSTTRTLAYNKVASNPSQPTWVPVPEQEFEETMAPKPLPDGLPKELPGVQWPVEDPVINPSPGPNPLPQPLFVPTGDPVRNPNYDPNAAPSPSNRPFMQPGVRVVPSPTPAEPWRVDIQPVNRPVETADPMPDPLPETDPNAPEGDKPKEKDPIDLCKEHPDIVACAKTGDIEAKPVPNEEKQLSINKDGGFGPESGTCPQPKTATVMGKTVSFQYGLLCDFAGYIKPIVIAFAWLSAALTFFGFSRKDS